VAEVDRYGGAPQPCAIADAYFLLERAFRAKVRIHGDTLQAARFADLAIRAMRLRFRHVEGCDQCLLAELESEDVAE
jgi:hypothetical protein